MNQRNRLSCLLLVLVLVFSMAISAFAQTEITTTGSILIKDTDDCLASEQTFKIYKALDLTAIPDDSGEITSFEYAVPEDLADFYADRYSADKDADDFLVKVCEGISAEANLFAFARDVAAAANEVPNTGAAVEGGYRFSDLPLGYYAISRIAEDGTAEPVSAFLLNTVTPNGEIVIKKPTHPIKDDTDKNDEDIIDTSNEADNDNGAEDTADKGSSTVTTPSKKTARRDKDSNPSQTFLVVMWVTVLVLTLAVVTLSICFFAYVRKNKK